MVSSGAEILEIGQLRVLLASRGDGVIVTDVDGFLPHVFERFRQEDASHMRSYAGLGLGLAIVKHLVELHGGAVAAASAGPGLGATFTVTLPPLASQRGCAGRSRDRRSAAGGHASEPGPSSRMFERGRRDVQQVTSSRITVYLIDDHPIVREAFAHAIADEPDLALVGQAGTAAEALRETMILKPVVVLVDLDIPDRDGIELLGALRAQLPETKLLVLSAHDDDYRVAEALRAGAQGYLIKTARIEEVIDGIRRVVEGGSPLSASIAGAVVRAMRKPSGAGALGMDALTTRERQVMRMLASGVSTRETAARLTLSPKTVETHRVRIYIKLGCKSAVELTRAAVRAGIIEA